MLPPLPQLLQLPPLLHQGPPVGAAAVEHQAHCAAGLGSCCPQQRGQSWGQQQGLRALLLVGQLKLLLSLGGDCPALPDAAARQEGQQGPCCSQQLVRRWGQEEGLPVRRQVVLPGQARVLVWVWLEAAQRGAAMEEGHPGQQARLQKQGSAERIASAAAPAAAGRWLVPPKGCRCSEAAAAALLHRRCHWHYAQRCWLWRHDLSERLRCLAAAPSGG
jgi:hypothetical protein